MARIGLERQVTALLSAMNLRGGYPMSLVCTDQGLLIASDGEVDAEAVAGFTSLFDDIVARAERDLGVARVDEVSLLDPGRGRYVVRPIETQGERRFFLVALVPADVAWRRNTTLMCRDLMGLLQPLAEAT